MEQTTDPPSVRCVTRHSRAVRRPVNVACCSSLFYYFGYSAVAFYVVIVLRIGGDVCGEIKIFKNHFLSRAHAFDRIFRSEIQMCRSPEGIVDSRQWVSAVATDDSASASNLINSVAIAKYPVMAMCVLYRQHASSSYLFQNALLGWLSGVKKN
jgi:hypothetical protein